MSLETLKKRANNMCELCGATDELQQFEVSPSDGSDDRSVCVCGTCHAQLSNQTLLDSNHWHCLSEAMWSEVPAVQVLSYRLLKKLGNQELLEMLYLDEDLQIWANQSDTTTEAAQELPKDSNGTPLNQGDSVTIIKDLEVKGANFTAKRGTVVKGILLNGNPEQVEGKVNGTRIVLLSCFLKKI